MKLKRKSKKKNRKKLQYSEQMQEMTFNVSYTVNFLRGLENPLEGSFFRIKSNLLLQEKSPKLRTQAFYNTKW